LAALSTLNDGTGHKKAPSRVYLCILHQYSIASTSTSVALE